MSYCSRHKDGSPSWVTFNQAKQLGGHVRKGEHGTLITYWRFDKKTGANEDGETESKVIPLLRYFTVFNVEQCEGFSALHETRPASNAIGTCESIVKAMPNPPRYDQSWRACYRPSTDTVSMPAKTAFSSLEAYFSTLFHELSHSTGHASRVGREGIEKLERFGSESYSREELVAELGAAMLCGVAGIAPSVIENSASYMQSWLTVLKTDSRLIVQAASAAQRAADYIRGINVADGEESASA